MQYMQLAQTHLVPWSTDSCPYCDLTLQRTHSAHTPQPSSTGGIQTTTRLSSRLAASSSLFVASTCWFSPEVAEKRSWWSSFAVCSAWSSCRHRECSAFSHCASHQPTNQPTKQPTNQPTNQAASSNNWVHLQLNFQREPAGFPIRELLL